MKINFRLLIYNGKSYSDANPGIAIVDYADFLACQVERDERYWNEVRCHFDLHKHLEFQMEVTSDVTIEYIEKYIAGQLGFDWDIFSKARNWKCCLLTGNRLVWIDDPKCYLKDISKYYTLNGEIGICFVLSNQAAEIWLEDGLRYYMHSREAGSHNKPHVHVDYRHESSASICIMDGSVLSGYIPSKALRKVREKISDNKEFLLECWNEKTDGLRVDINNYFGIIPLEIGETNSKYVD